MNTDIVARSKITYIFTKYQALVVLEANKAAAKSFSYHSKYAWSSRVAGGYSSINFASTSFSSSAPCDIYGRCRK
jgi:hypothetical protein